jgi:hypothetical protein
MIIELPPVPSVTMAVMRVDPPPWFLTSWGQFGIFMLSAGLIFGIMIGWGIHRNRDQIFAILFGEMKPR